MARLTTKARETSFSSATIEVTGHHGVDNRPHSGSPRRNEMLRGCFEGLPTAKTRASARRFAGIALPKVPSPPRSVPPKADRGGSSVARVVDRPRVCLHPFPPPPAPYKLVTRSGRQSLTGASPLGSFRPY